MDIAKLIRKSMKRMSQRTISLLQSELYCFLQQDETQEQGVEGFLQLVDKLKTDADRVNCLHQRLEKYGLLANKFKADLKNDAKATKSKERGNRFFTTGRYNKALRMYTKTIMKARTQELLAIAYANRSAALFKLGLYEECLTDIERALANEYPQHLKPKVVVRRARSLELLRKSKNVTKFYEEPPMIPRNKRNPIIQCASNSVEVRVDEKSKKHVFATRDIQIGDVVAVETPFTAIIGEAYLYHCHECFDLCYNPIPCHNCSQVIYCSEACREKALIEYHQDECSILLSLRKLVGRNTNFLLGLKMLFHTRDEKADEVLRLTENMEDRNMYNEPLQLAMSAAFIYDLVKKYTTKFDGPNGETTQKNFKDFLVTYLQLCIVQTMGVDELCPNEEDEDQMTQETIACAIYPFYGLFRHACCPNVYAQHHGLNRVVRAIRTIKKGQECFASFGPHYIEEEKEGRQDRLFYQYHFKCTCRACEENWPQLGLLPSPITTAEDLLFMYEIRGANVDVAKNTIYKKILQMKQLERFEPSADLTFQQKMLLHCYDILGNKRLIQ